VSNEATRVTVLRHGAVAGRPYVFRGASDEPLSPEGRARMFAVTATLGPLDAIATSPLRRCRAVAEELAGVRGLPLAILPDLAEMRFGAWEGRTGAEVAVSEPDAYAAWCRFEDTASAPGGETLGAFRRRVLAAWSTWLADAGGGHRLLVTHAGVMRVLLQDLLALPAAALYRVALPEAAHFQVSLLPGHAPILLSLNACADSCSPSSS
jgi:broad specificity phosphatase PhoE